jgi:hypothetical protein
VLINAAVIDARSNLCNSTTSRRLIKASRIPNNNAWPELARAEASDDSPRI